MFNLIMIASLDDIKFFSLNEEEHCLSGARVVAPASLVMAEKCVYHQLTLSFSGFITSPGWLEMDPDNAVAVLNRQTNIII